MTKAKSSEYLIPNLVTSFFVVSSVQVSLQNKAYFSGSNPSFLKAVSTFCARTPKCNLALSPLAVTALLNLKIL